MRSLSRLNREESGVAMVIAMLVVFVVVLLSIVVLDMSIHNTDQSAYDRKRVTSIAAAEAGIDRAWNLIQFTAPQDLTDTFGPITLGSEPGPATYTIDFTWYESVDPLVEITGEPDQANPPVAALITAVGETNTDVPRTMQTFVTLAPNYGGFGSAVLAVTDTTLETAPTILGNDGNDGNIYVTDGDLTIDNSMTVYGNIYVHDGGVRIENNSEISGELWANESITIDNPATVGTNVISSTGQIDTETDPGGTIGGFAMAGTTIEIPPLRVSGTTYEHSPQGPPPTVEFPKLCQLAIAGVCEAMPWAAQGFTVTSFTDCAAARTFLRTGTLAGNQVVWIDSACTLAIQNNDVITFSGNLAIVTQGGITMANRNTWAGAAGNELFFIVNYREALACGSGLYNISTGNLSRFQGASVLFYSPCTVTLNNLNGFTGQILGNTVDIKNNFTLSYEPVLVPGLDSIQGFDQNIVYVREVVN